MRRRSNRRAARQALSILFSFMMFCVVVKLGVYAVIAAFIAYATTAILKAK